jgi:hypothetical protein
MKRIAILAAVGAPAAAAALFAAPALAGAQTKVSFRVEGVSRTLLPAKTVAVPDSGSITQGGTPPGTCPADSAAGAFNAATGGNWSGTYSNGLGIEVTKILGETGIYSKGHYWEFFVDNRAASVGICDQKVEAGDQLLFADVPAKGAAEFPIVISAPARATAGTAFRVKASYYPTKSEKARPLAGVSFTGVKGTTNATGVATVTASRAGKLSVVGSKRGEIRSAAATVVVAK